MELNDVRSTLRVEDHRFLTGTGRYTDDNAPDGRARAVFVRSPHAHAKIGAIDLNEALASPGVLGIFTATDLAADGIGDLPGLGPVVGKDGMDTGFAVGAREVRFDTFKLCLGEPVAIRHRQVLLPT